MNQLPLASLDGVPLNSWGAPVNPGDAEIAELPNNKYEHADYTGDMDWNNRPLEDNSNPPVEDGGDDFSGIGWGEPEHVNLQAVVNGVPIMRMEAKESSPPVLPADFRIALRQDDKGHSMHGEDLKIPDLGEDDNDKDNNKDNNNVLEPDFKMPKTTEFSQSYLDTLVRHEEQESADVVTHYQLGLIARNEAHTLLTRIATDYERLRTVGICSDAWVWNAWRRFQGDAQHWAECNKMEEVLVMGNVDVEMDKGATEDREWIKYGPRRDGRGWGKRRR